MRRGKNKLLLLPNYKKIVDIDNTSHLLLVKGIGDNIFKQKEQTFAART